MLVTLSGMVNAPVLPPGYWISVVLSLSYNTPSCELYIVLAELTVIAVRRLQPKKALFPMLVTLSGIVMLVRLVQPSKAPCPMLVKLALVGNVTLVSPVQFSKALYPMLVTLSGIITVLRYSLKFNAVKVGL